jgi:hypothetical protein
MEKAIWSMSWNLSVTWLILCVNVNRFLDDDFLSYVNEEVDDDSTPRKKTTQVSYGEEEG